MNTEARFGSLRDSLAYVKRRRSEGADVTLTPRAQAFFEAAVGEESPTVPHVVVSDDGAHVLVDLAVEPDTGHGEDG